MPGLIIHASGVKIGSRVILFCAPSGGGKSTIVEMILRLAKNKCVIINDDRIIIRKKNGCFVAYGTPWHGEYPFVSNSSGILSKIYILKKDRRTYVERLSRSEAFPIIYQRVIRGVISSCFQKNRIHMSEVIVNRIPVLYLHFRRGGYGEINALLKELTQ